jgi:uncharacterized membrane protein YqgA involved in biofilm formation
MTGTIINVVAIIAGTIIGILFGTKFNVQLRKTLQSIMGLFTLMLGISMFLKTQDSIVCLIGLVVGILIGELLKIEEGLEKLGGFLQLQSKKILGEERSGDKEKFISGFITATLLFLIGPIGILGSIQDGLSVDSQLLIIKSILDGIMSIVFASTLGIGVAFSSIPILFYQGGISLLAEQAQRIMTEPMITEMTAAGGVLLGAIAVSSLLEIKKIRVSSSIPALILTPFLVWLLAKF